MTFGRAAAVALLGLGIMSCKMIPEEFPVAADTPPIPTSTPTTEPSPKPTKVKPTPTPLGNPTSHPPKPTATHKPSGGCNPDSVTDNCRPTTHAGAVVFYVACPPPVGVIPNSKYATHAKAGCWVRLDSNARDASDQVTTPKNSPVWTFGGTPYQVGYPNGNPFTPMVHGSQAGTFTAFVTIDGFRSPTITFKFD